MDSDPIRPQPLESSAACTSQSVDVTLLPLHPSADWLKVQERLSQTRVALEERQLLILNLQQQVKGLMCSLQGKHEESSLLQLELANARQSLDQIQASWQGDLSQVQDSLVSELQSELSSRTSQCVSLQSEVQYLQFQLQQTSSQSKGALEAERRERERLAAELGQARLLVVARARHVEEAMGEAEAIKRRADHEIESWRKEMMLVKHNLIEAKEQLHLARAESEKHLHDARTAQQSAAAAIESASTLQQQVDRLMREAMDMRLQTEWLEGSLEDLQGGSGGGHGLGRGAGRTSQQDQQRSIQTLQELLTTQSKEGIEAQQQLQDQLHKVVSEQHRREAQWQRERAQLVAELEQLRAPEPPSTGRQDAPAWSSALGLDSDDEDIHDSDAMGHEEGACAEAVDGRPGSLLPPGEGDPADVTRVDAAVQTSSTLAEGQNDSYSQHEDVLKLQQFQQQQQLESVALLEVAREEVQRLKELNQRLLETRGGPPVGFNGGRMVPVDDVRKALAEVRQAGRAKLEEALSACSSSWAARLAEVSTSLAEESARLEDVRKDKDAADADRRLLSLEVSDLRARLTASMSECDGLRADVERGAARLHVVSEELSRAEERLQGSVDVRVRLEEQLRVKAAELGHLEEVRNAEMLNLTQHSCDHCVQRQEELLAAGSALAEARECTAQLQCDLEKKQARACELERETLVLRGRLESDSEALGRAQVRVAELQHSLEQVEAVVSERGIQLEASLCEASSLRAELDRVLTESVLQRDAASVELQATSAALEEARLELSSTHDQLVSASEGHQAALARQTELKLELEEARAALSTSREDLARIKDALPGGESICDRETESRGPNDEGAYWRAQLADKQTLADELSARVVELQLLLSEAEERSQVATFQAEAAATARLSEVVCRAEAAEKVACEAGEMVVSLRDRVNTLERLASVRNSTAKNLPGNGVQAGAPSGSRRKPLGDATQHHLNRVGQGQGSALSDKVNQKDLRNPQTLPDNPQDILVYNLSAPSELLTKQPSHHHSVSGHSVNLHENLSLAQSHDEAMQGLKQSLLHRERSWAHQEASTDRQHIYNGSVAIGSSKGSAVLQNDTVSCVQILDALHAEPNWRAKGGSQRYTAASVRSHYASDEASPSPTAASESSAPILFPSRAPSLSRGRPPAFQGGPRSNKGLDVLAAMNALSRSMDQTLSAVRSTGGHPVVDPRRRATTAHAAPPKHPEPYLGLGSRRHTVNEASLGDSVKLHQRDEGVDSKAGGTLRAHHYAPPPLVMRRRVTADISLADLKAPSGAVRGIDSCQG